MTAKAIESPREWLDRICPQVGLCDLNSKMAKDHLAAAIEVRDAVVRLEAKREGWADGFECAQAEAERKIAAGLAQHYRGYVAECEALKLVPKPGYLDGDELDARLASYRVNASEYEAKAAALAAQCARLRAKYSAVKGGV